MFRCVYPGCRVAFLHPQSTDDCSTVEGKCSHLVKAGWKSATVKVYLIRYKKHPKHLTSSGGWLCPTHGKV